MTEKKIVERFLAGVPCNLDEEGIQRMNEMVSDHLGQEVNENFHQKIEKTIDERQSMNEIKIYKVRYVG